MVPMKFQLYITQTRLKYLRPSPWWVPISELASFPATTLPPLRVWEVIEPFSISFALWSMFQRSAIDLEVRSSVDCIKKISNCSSWRKSYSSDIIENCSQSLFDRYRQSLVSKDDDEGWHSEYRRYLKDSRPADVKKDTDVVQWW
jgi:hypothetical protein